jgi:transcription elongation factor S-II
MSVTRDRCKNIFINLYEELSKESPQNAEIFKNPQKIGKNVEKSIFNKTIKTLKNSREPVTWDNPRFRNEYHATYLKVRANMTYTPNAPEVRQRLSLKQIKPTDMATMTHRQLAFKQWEETDILAQEYWDKRIIGAAKVTAPDHKGAYQCGKCKSWRTTYTERQTRSADEPMSVFCLCENCGKRWRF